MNITLSVQLKSECFQCISQRKHQNKSTASGLKCNIMNNINAVRYVEVWTGSVFFFYNKINCEISSDLIAYYVMSV